MKHSPFNLADAIVENSLVGIVCVAAPEGKLFPDRLSAGIAKLQAFGFRVKVANHVTQQVGFASAEPNVVAAELTEFLRDPEIAAVICAGGGIATNRILPYLDFELLGKTPKVLVGASNPTTLLNAVSQYSQYVTFHGPSIIWDFGDPEQPEASVRHFLDVVSKGETILAPLNDWIASGEASGRLLGGNLTSLLHLVGTRFEPSWDKAILFWEEIGEDTAHIAARLTELQQADVLSQLSGMIVGQLVDCEDSEGVSVLEAVRDICEGYSFPVAYNLPFGHTTLKYTLPIGATVRMSSADRTLTALGPTVLCQK